MKILKAILTGPLVAVALVIGVLGYLIAVVAKACNVEVK
jgi:hypothetical protein